MKRRKGPVDFSVSVDASTKKILEAHADRLYGGNMSAMISALGREAEKREAMHWLIEDSGGSVLNDELRAELATQHYGRKKRRTRAT